MRTDTARPVRLTDFRPPDWLVETVDLDVRLDPTASRVRSRLVLKPNPKGRYGAPLVLDGEELSLVHVLLEGTMLSPESYVVTAESLTIPNPPPQGFGLEIETLI